MKMTDHTPLVFVDVETTGLSARTGGRVIEIGAIRVENNKVVAKYKQLLHPGTDIPHFITNITGIKDEDVEKAPTFEEVAHDVSSFFKDALFVAHNVNFDYGFMQHEFLKAGLKFQKDRLCTVRLSRWWFPEQRSHSLDKIIQRHGFSIKNRHRAYDDAAVLHAFYEHLRAIDEVKLLLAMSKTTTWARHHG